MSSGLFFFRLLLVPQLSLSSRFSADFPTGFFLNLSTFFLSLHLLLLLGFDGRKLCCFIIICLFLFLSADTDHSTANSKARVINRMQSIQFLLANEVLLLFCPALLDLVITSIVLNFRSCILAIVFLFSGIFLASLSAAPRCLLALWSSLFLRAFGVFVFDRLTFLWHRRLDNPSGLRFCFRPAFFAGLILFGVLLGTSTDRSLSFLPFTLRLATCCRRRRRLFSRRAFLICFFRGRVFG
mmetsp:Transcript_55984/g.88712  ORF Transcript_55984/g.88712 Transcript_55984/m.88712 type:complete len:240 (+) Transcript_55984:1409-2128(+)